jgi:hypothetical protein
MESEKQNIAILKKSLTITVRSL